MAQGHTGRGNTDFLQPMVLVTPWVVCQTELPALGPPSWGSADVS